MSHPESFFVKHIALELRLYTKMYLVEGYFPSLSGPVKSSIITEVSRSGGDIRISQKQLFHWVAMGFSL